MLYFPNESPQKPLKMLKSYKNPNLVRCLRARLALFISEKTFYSWENDWTFFLTSWGIFRF